MVCQGFKFHGSIPYPRKLWNLSTLKKHDSYIIMQACILIVSAAEMKKQLIAFVIDYNNLNIQEKIAKGL